MWQKTEPFALPSELQAHNQSTGTDSDALRQLLYYSRSIRGIQGEKSRSVIVLEPFDGYLRIDGRTNGQSVLIVADLGVMSAEQVSFLL